MFRYNLVSAFCYIRRNPIFSFINIIGLSLGMTLVVFLMLWMQFEFSFDKFHKNAGRIYRVVAEFNHSSNVDNFAHTPAPLGEALKNDIPEVTDYVRFGSLGRTLVSYGDVQFWETIDLTDPSIFNIFSFELVSGNPERALENPNSIVISEKIARKYFGNKDPLGQIMFIYENKIPVTVTGVMNDVPVNSQLQFDFLIPFNRLKNNLSWGAWNYSTYLLAREKNSFHKISNKLKEVLEKNTKDTTTRLHIQPLTSIHLHSQLRSDLSTNRSIEIIYIIGSVIFLVLIVACVNYMNLATARYTTRGKEVGLRKVAGATSSNLALQFLFESFVVTVISFVIASILCSLLMSVFTSITGIPMIKGVQIQFSTVVKFILLIILISLISGSYPAFLLSSASPVSAIHNDIKPGRVISVLGFRKALIIFQFCITLILITCTLIIRSQMSFIRNKNLGLMPDQVVVIPIYQAGVNSKYEMFKNEILTYPDIVKASAVGYFPGLQGYHQNVWWEGLQADDISNLMTWIPSDQDFLRTLKIELVYGEDFPKIIQGDNLNSYILNESAVKKIGWTDPIGKQFEISGINLRGKVIGVVRDFNFRSLHDELEPVAIVFYPTLFDNLMVKISGRNVPETLDFLRNIWKNLFPQIPFEYSFLSDDFQKMYEKENMTLKIITSVSILSLFISCIGLFGLVLFTVDRRKKEIGIRKAAGSTSGKILAMLNFQFIKWILAAFVISCPVIVYFMDRWIQNFAFRVNINWWLFAIAVIITVTMALISVSWHTWYIASRNPAECLRHE